LMGADTSVAAVVLSYNRKQLLVATLQGLREQTRHVDEIIVVDNGSTDGTSTLVEDLFPEVTLLRIEPNKGFGSGIVRGLRHAHSSGHGWIWYFDDDDRPVPEALARLLEAADRLAPIQAGMIGTWNAAMTGEHLVEGEMWNRGMRRKAVGSDQDLYPVEVVTFSGTLISRSLLSAVGFPRTDYFMCYEDVEFSLRAKDAGFEIYVLPTPLTAMLRAGTVGAPWRGYYQTRNHLALVLERRSASEVWWWLVRTTKFCLGALLWHDRKWQRIRMRLLGAWHGLRGVRGQAISLGS